jgi:hypothetical protein
VATKIKDSIMTDQTKYLESDPRHHMMKIKRMLDDVSRHAREDVIKAADPKARALFETNAPREI